MKDSSLKLTLREMQVFFRSPKTLVGLAAVSLLLGLTGPFQTFEHLRLGPRLAYWTVTCVLTFVAGSFGATFVGHVLAEKNINKIVLMLIGWMVTGSLVTIVVIAINYFAFGTEIIVGDELPELFLYCFVIALAVLMLVNYYAADVPETRASPLKILNRINVTLRAPLISLSVSDHYVEVATIKGKELVLIRLSDAIAETTGAAGLQIHRSHWVALDQIASVTKKDGKTVISMQNGDSFPISRTYMPQAKELGII